ncbi:septal ring lytic transglycosylase RlpA family protein [Roseomonas sp. BN140053]|uniref:septal ring lytic transglycosylase RlpA family protein n=1 Tax=Roseomonas sp. BN140053 TaxID=3391898 RepID=UPI0039E852AE
MRRAALAAIGLAMGLASLPHAEAGSPRRDVVARTVPGAHPVLRTQRGKASFYANRFHGRRMANGRRFDRQSASAASRTLPLGTRALVTNLENGRRAVVTIEDRGPHLGGRVLDVSPGTASQLGMRQRGVVMVEIVPLAAGEHG